MKKKNILLEILVLFLGGLALYTFTTNDAFLYRQPLLKISAVKNGKTRVTKDEFNNHDKQTIQKVTGYILNGTDRGKKYTFNNTYTESGGMDQHLYAGQQVFVNVYQQRDQTSVSIITFKRDTYLAMLLWLMACLLFIVMQVKGLRTIGSVILNFVLFLFVVQLDVNWNFTSFFGIFAVSALIFTVLTLVLILGWNKQCLVTLSAIIIGTATALGLCVLVMWITKDKGMHYEALDFATQQPKQLFLSSSLIGLLGTVMDAATDIVSTLFEMKRRQPQVSFKRLYFSGRKVGNSIMGPLINVLLLIFFAETITLAILYFRTGNSIGYTFSWTMSLGLVQALISGIGITLVIPSASFLAAITLGRMEK
ncbi:YibE/F family protein [Liquorilactobacillus oeni]|uniref:YibE/F family protein n=1 Tax=Liquorilactobacillus oeni TaxID=303241 RepID=UPI000ABF8447